MRWVFAVSLILGMLALIGWVLLSGTRGRNPDQRWGSRGRQTVAAAVAFVASASDEGMAAAQQVSEASYRDFLDNWLFTHAGDNRGVGIDPGYVANRAAPDASTPRTEYILDFFNDHYAHLGADLVCCRHTLEHKPWR